MSKQQSALVKYLLARASEASTVKGVLSIVSALGVTAFSGMDPAQVASICSAVYAGLSIILPDDFGGA